MNRKKIVVVDDDIDTLRFLNDSLSAEGYEVYTTDGGYNGVRLAQLHHPDLIILDVSMPILDGIKTLEYLRKAEDTARIPIIFMTGQRLENVRRAVSNQIRVSFLSKPISLGKLHEQIRSIIN